jgi:hypothetical protein
MKWNNQENNAVYQRTIGGERAHKYYYIWEIKGGKWIAGRFTFGRDYDFRGKTFPSSARARAYCEKIDRDTVIIEGITA